MSGSHRKELEQRRDHLLARLQALASGPIMRGSIVERSRRCGKANCACAQDEKARHVGFYLSVHLDGSTQVVHLRRSDVPRVREAVERYDRLWRTLSELTACEIADMRRVAKERRRRPSRLA